MTSYRVVWEVDGEADTPREAAIAAMLMQDASTTANVFTVARHDQDNWSGPGVVSEEIDLGDEPRCLIVAELRASGKLDELDEKDDQ